jgi:hypothetical protein
MNARWQDRHLHWLDQWKAAIERLEELQDLLVSVDAGQESPKADGADEDAEQGRGGDESVLRRANAKLSRQERKRDAGHEDDETFEELAGGGERPNQPLHACHRRGPEVGSIGPHWQFVDVLLNRLCADLRPRFRRHSVIHPETLPDGFYERSTRARRGLQAPGRGAEKRALIRRATPLIRGPALVLG